MRFKRSWNVSGQIYIYILLSISMSLSLDLLMRGYRRNWKMFVDLFIPWILFCLKLLFVGLKRKRSFFLVYSRHEKVFVSYTIRSSYSQVFLSPSSIRQYVGRYDMPWRRIWPRFHVWRTCKIATISPTVNRLSQWRQFS